MMQPGMFLCSRGCGDAGIVPLRAPQTVSIESAMRVARLQRVAHPVGPIEMPSLTPMVLNRMPTRPAATTPLLDRAAKSLRCMLQVFPSYHMAVDADLRLLHVVFGEAGAVEHGCEAPWLFGWVMRELYLFNWVDVDVPEITSVSERLRLGF